MAQSLRYEKFNKKTTFKLFINKVYNSFISLMNDGSNLKPIFKNLKDPFDSLKNHIPKDIDSESEVEKAK